YAGASGKITASQRIFRARDVVERSLCHNLAAGPLCARTQIKNVVGSPNRFFIVFDYDDGVPKIAQFSQCSQQTRVVALMQTDARFIENVENTSQTGADLCGESYPLRFAPGKRAALAIQCQVAKPDLHKKLQPRANLADHVCHDGLLLLGQVEISNESQRVFHVLLAELMDIQFAAVSGLDCDGKDFRFESCAAADLACLTGHECSNAIPRELALGLLIKPLH